MSRAKEPPPPKPPTPQERLAAATEAQAAATGALVEVERRKLWELQRDLQSRREEERGREEARPGHRRPDLFKPLLGYLTAIPNATPFTRVIPPEFWSLDTDAAVIACPCGETVAVALAIPQFCGGSDWVEEDRERDEEKDGCGRAYLYDGTAVRVAFSPARVVA